MTMAVWYTQKKITKKLYYEISFKFTLDFFSLILKIFDTTPYSAFYYLIYLFNTCKICKLKVSLLLKKKNRSYCLIYPM